MTCHILILSLWAIVIISKLWQLPSKRIGVAASVSMGAFYPNRPPPLEHRSDLRHQALPDKYCRLGFSLANPTQHHAKKKQHLVCFVIRALSDWFSWDQDYRMGFRIKSSLTTLNVKPPLASPILAENCSFKGFWEFLIRSKVSFSVISLLLLLCRIRGHFSNRFGSPPPFEATADISFSGSIILAFILSFWVSSSSFSFPVLSQRSCGIAWK